LEFNLVANLLTQALTTSVFLMLPLAGAVLVGGLLAGMIKVITQIEDASISIACRVAALGLIIYVSGPQFVDAATNFARSSWSPAISSK
jgi:flagellar biosynthesis protein FliQ